jgi:hypothetical protein
MQQGSRPSIRRPFIEAYRLCFRCDTVIVCGVSIASAQSCVTQKFVMEELGPAADRMAEFALDDSPRLQLARLEVE